MLIPWALVYKQFGWAGFFVGGFFLILLAIGMAYEWRKGDLEWDRPKPQPPVIQKPKSTQTVIKEEVVEV